MKKRTRGFTLIELLVVISIVGILAVAFVPMLLNAPAKARDAKRISDINKINEFLLTKYIETGNALPASSNSPSSGLGCINSSSISGISKDINNNIDFFGGKFPQEPKSDMCIKFDSSGSRCMCTGAYYYYKMGNTAKSPYFLIAGVENEKNGNVQYYYPVYHLAQNGGTSTYRLSETGSHYAVLGQE